MEIDIEEINQHAFQKRDDERWAQIRRDAVQIYCALRVAYPDQVPDALMQSAVQQVLDLEAIVVDCRVEEAERMAKQRAYAELMEKKRLPR